MLLKHYLDRGVSKAELSRRFPLANHPYRRLGVRHAPEPAPRRLPATVSGRRINRTFRFAASLPN